MIWKLNKPIGMGIVGLFGLAIYVQSCLLLNHDVSWCMHAARRLMEGGTYFKDFFDLNPPLALYLYAPPVMMANFVHAHIGAALQVYIFLLAAISLYVCALLMGPLFSEQRIFGGFVLMALAFLFLLMPGKDFGQREHILMLLTMPYFLATAFRLAGHRLKTAHGILIGAVAAVGFTLKPYFLLSFFLVELYFIWHQVCPFSKLRAEGATVVVFLGFYIWALFIFHTNYIHLIVPLAIKYYYLGFHDPWDAIFLHPVLFYCFFLGLLSFCRWQYVYQKECAVFLLAMLGFLVAFLLQQTLWLYHYFPAVCSGFILSMFLFQDFFGSAQKSKIHYIFNFFLGLIIFAFPIYDLSNNLNEGLVYKREQGHLIASMTEYVQHHSVYFFSYRIHNIFPAVDYAGAQFVSRFPHLSLLPGLLNKAKEYAPSDLPHGLKQDQEQFIDMVTEDLVIHHPDYVFVDFLKYSAYLSDLNFNYINYFSHSPKFQRVWRSYHYVATIELPLIFKAQAKTSSLYLARSFQAIKLNNLPDAAIVLTGNGKHRQVFFTDHQEFLEWKDRPVVREIELTDTELTVLKNKSGPVDEKHSATKIINQIIHKAMVAGSPRSFEYQIYARNDAPHRLPERIK